MAREFRKKEITFSNSIVITSTMLSTMVGRMIPSLKMTTEPLYMLCYTAKGLVDAIKCMVIKMRRKGYSVLSRLANLNVNPKNQGISHLWSERWSNQRKNREEPQCRL